MQEIEIPPDMLLSIKPGLEMLVQENRISYEIAQTILNTRVMNIEIAQSLGLVAHSGQNIDTMMMSALHHSQSASPLSITMQQQQQQPLLLQNATNSNLPNLSHQYNYHYNGINLSNFPMSVVTVPGMTTSQCGGSSGICGTGSVAAGDSSPLCTSPMHQITRGISGLNTGGGGGSISRGTPASSNEPLDLTMDVVTTYVPSGFYDMHQLAITPTVRLAPSPPTSPNNLCIIQEENGHQVACTPSPPTPTLDYLHSHPQICLTDVQGSEITLVALSDSSRDSEDSLEGNNSKTTTSFQGLLITEPSSDMPSITRGVGRKTSLENERHEKLETDVDTYARRGSDKSLGFSDDSLSNDSNLSPSGPEPSGSSGFHSHSEHDTSRLSPDSLSDRRLSDEYYELPLPYDCSNLESSHILEIVKKTIDSKMPPKGFSVEATASTSSIDASNLNIEYSSGLQVELQVFEGRSKENKGIKLRRISGDQLEYGKLCQQLITSLTVN